MVATKNAFSCTISFGREIGNVFPINTLPKNEVGERRSGESFRRYFHSKDFKKRSMKRARALTKWGFQMPLSDVS
jgi:hypothetical protein